MLLDKDDPNHILGITKKPFLVPEADCETGDMKRFWRENGIFPCGAILEDNGIIRLYYGAGEFPPEAEAILRGTGEFSIRTFDRRVKKNL